MDRNSTQSASVNIQAEVNNSAPLPGGLPSAFVFTADIYPVLIITVILFILIYYCATSYALTNFLFPLDRKFLIPPKGLKRIIWNIHATPLLIAFLGGLYGLIMARNIIFLTLNIVNSYFIFIELTAPKSKEKATS